MAEVAKGDVSYSNVNVVCCMVLFYIIILSCLTLGMSLDMSRHGDYIVQIQMQMQILTLILYALCSGNNRITNSKLTKHMP
jgi:hypothetical protein